MNVLIENATAADRSFLWSLLQQHLDELSVFTGSHRVDGEHPYPYFDLYWQDASRFAHLIFCDQAVVGFALVNSHVLDPASMASIAEFYIRPAFRKQGIGRLAVKGIVDQRPGRWEAKIESGNVAALAFWSKVFAEGKDVRITTLPEGMLMSGAF